jgi:hypothetical protein
MMNKIVSRFYITPVRHRLRLRRMPGGPARNAIACEAGGRRCRSWSERFTRRQLGGLKFLSLQQPAGYFGIFALSLFDIFYHFYY